MRLKSTENNKGYTLIELIITLAIIGIMIIPIFNTFTESYKVNALVKRQIAGAYLAQNIIEELKVSTSETLADISIADVNDGIRSYQRRSGRYVYDVQVDVIDKTDQLNINASSNTVIQTPVPDADVTMAIPSSGEDVLLSFSDPIQSDLKLLSSDSTISIELEDATMDRIRLSIDGLHASFTPVHLDRININVIGAEPNQMQSYLITCLNESSRPLYVTKINDADNDISLMVDDEHLSTSDVWISSNMPLAQGVLSEAEKWYNVVVTVSYKGTVYEVLETTIGK